MGIYEDENRFKKFINMGDGSLHTFVTDIYKPKYCELDNEIRMLVYLSNSQDLYTLDGISETSANNSLLPEYLYYDFKSQQTSETGKAILKVFCKDEATRDKLHEKCGYEMIEFI